MAVGDAGYVGLVRHPGGRLHLGAALDPAACNRRRGPLPVIEDILSAAGIRLPSLAAADLLGTKPLTGRRAAVGGHRVLAVGDACGYVEPFTGEGMAWAIRSALAAVDLLHGDPSVWPADRAARWGRRHAAQVARRQTLCHCLRHLLRRPAASAACVAAARRLPWLPALLARRLSA
jgi:2-polyprenyl-6-methoxyphenol hydroxylase-like FAD-dependent oxidoreductase